MSRIKRLKIKGFKSFANPTVLDFEKGFNTIVGANGSGKSNVFDAMCFVLGRISSKGLRADKLGNLVFNGGKTNKSAKEAEVSIFLSNDNSELLNVDLEEVKISRVVKKTGLSNYYLNNNKATRTQIVEVLKKASIDPDGYNVILQGDITKIVNMSCVERRELIEEIADISNYEEKRQKSCKKLESVEASLKEADLLLEEKTKYIKDLKSEKEAAIQYYNVKDDLRFYNLLLIKAKLIKNSLLYKKKKEDLLKNEKVLEEYKKELSEFEFEQKKIDEQILEVEKEIEIKSHNDFIEVTNNITATESQIQNLKEKRAESLKQIEEIKDKDVQVGQNIKDNLLEIKNMQNLNKDLILKKKGLQKDLDLSLKDLDELKKNISSKSFEKLDQIDKLIGELNEKKFNKNQIKQDNFIEVEKLNTKIEHFREEVEKVKLNAQTNKEQFKVLKENKLKLKSLILEISKNVSNNSQVCSKLNHLQKEYSDLVQDHSKLKMRVESSKDFISTNKAVEKILSFKKSDSKIFGSVCELGSIENKFSMAIETIAGKNLFNIVVEDDSCAVKYINFLKENKIGNCTFLPLNKIRANFNLDLGVLNKAGVIDYALNLVSFDKKYERIFHLIFQNTLVIEDIKFAKQIGIGEFKMVTLDGDIVAKSGAMSGGFKFRKKSFGAFKDDRSVSKLESLDLKISTLRSSLDILEDQKVSSEKKIYDLRQEKIEVEAEVLKYEKLLSIQGEDLDSINLQIKNLSDDRAIFEKNLDKIQKQILEIEKQIESYVLQRNKIKLSSGNQVSIMEKISKLEERRDLFKEDLMRVNSQIDSNLIKIDKVLKPEILNLEKIEKQSVLAIKDFKEKVQGFSVQIKDLEVKLKSMKIKEKELSKDYKEFINKRDFLKKSREKVDLKYNKIYEVYERVKEKIATLNYAISEFDTIAKTLEEELEILYEGLKIEFLESSNDVNFDDSKVLDNIEELNKRVEDKLKSSNIDVKDLQNRVNNLKNKLNSFGSINLKAVEIFDKLSEEFNVLIDKRETLNSDKLEILKLIEEMDVKKKEKFLETFYKLRENFIRIFATLSTKGDAELNLEDEKDIFNNGVDIKVRMTKKNYLDIKSLSGGEKTITAIAFIFAVQEFNPASFYIFDEVDAALDIMNAEKLGKLISNYSNKAQYIVVSHSEHLIQSSDVIYGVTMNQAKISDVLSLDLRDMKDYVDSDSDS